MTHPRPGALLGPELVGQLIQVGGSGQIPGSMFELAMSYAVASQALYTGFIHRLYILGLKAHMFA